MRKLVSLTLAILAIAVLVFPSAATARGVEFPSGKYYQEPFNTLGKDLFTPGSVTGGGAYSLDNGRKGSPQGASYSAGQKLVCITFDDGWQNQYVNAVPNLQGFKATFAVVTNWVQTDVGDCMSWTELHTLADQGMDIASHTITHDNWQTLNATTMQNEVTGSKTALEQAGFTVRTFVYPFYYYNDSVVTAVKNAGYICARSGALNHPYTPGIRTDDDQYKIDSVGINDDDIPNLDSFKNIVDQATDYSVICLNYHSVSDDHSAPTPITSVANFRAQMQYLKDNNFAVVLLPDLVQDPWISCSPVSMAFSGIQGGSNPAAQALSITNTGGGSTFNWTASSSAAWLTLSPTGGTAPGSVTVTADVSGLSAGTYNDTITITATGATNTPQTVPVTLTVQTPSPNWLAGWSYRKQIAVAGSSAGAQTNYPMKLTINRSAGTDSGATVYLGTRCASDYKDIRFTAFDGTSLLDYWIESSSSSTATVWVELDSVPASPGTANFNLYYGNSGATSASNIKNTFTFADDFEDGSLDATGRWPTVGGTGGTVTEVNGVLTVTAGPSDQKYVASAIPYTNGYSLHARAKLDSITGSGYRLIGFVTTPGSYQDKLFTTTYRSWDSETNFVAISGDGSNNAQANMNVPADTDYHISECRRYAVSGNNYDSFIIYGGTYGGVAVSGSYPTATARYIYINSDVSGKAIILDWIFLRKFVSIEPTWAAWGNEETPGSPAKAITAFNFNALTPPVTGVVTEATHTIALSVPYGTTVTALVPTITHTGTSVNPASGASNNFTTPQTYTVTAADSSTQAYTVTVSVAPNSAKAITAFNFNALTPAVTGVVTEATHTVALSVPYGTNVTALVPTITHTGASVNPASGASNNFTTPQTYTVTAADSSTQAYTVTVSVAPNSAKAITAFNFNALTPAVTGVVTEATHTIALSVPYGTAVTALVPTISHTGASVNPASGASNNFTTPQTYTVTAADSSTQAYTVTVSVAPNSAKAITAFNFNALTPAVTGVVTEATHTVALSVPYGTNVTALVPTITHTGASVNPASGASNNFTTPQTYTVTAADSSTQAYTVTVSVAPNSTKAITAFNFNALTPAVTGVVTEATHTVALSVPYGTAVTALVPTITHTGASVNPASGASNNFTTPQTYTVTAADSSTQAYTVTVTVAPNSTKAITAFNFNALTPAVTGVVTEATHTVALSVPYGTAVTALVPTITHTGASVNPASGASNNFTTPQTYTVTAADASTQAYTVTVTVLPQLPTIAVSPSSLTFNGVQGGTNPATQTLSISNTGGGTLNWTASSSAAWLTLAPTGGTAPSTVTVTTNTTGLNANTYNGTITITSTGATNTPQTVPAALTVLPQVSAKVLGADSGAAGASGPGWVVMDRWPALSSSTVSEIRIYCTGAGNVKVAAYTDSGGSPGSLLSAVNTSTPVTAGWNTISITPVAMTSGTYYWLAFASDTAVVNYQNSSGRQRRGSAITYSGYNFPSPANMPSYNYDLYYNLMAGWGDSIPTPPALPSITNAGATSVTGTSATLNGNLTSDGNATTTVTIYWGPADGLTTPSNWANHADLGTKTAGAFSTPITGLTTGTTYYYRCSATNSVGTAWASSTSFFTALSSAKVLGADSGAAGASGSGWVIMDRWPATSTASVNEIRINCTGAGNVKVAAYTDSGGSPGSLLSAVNTSTPVTAGWNTISITPVAMTSGTYYWLAFASDTAVVNYQNSSGRQRRGSAITYSGYNFPSPANMPSYNYDLYYNLMAGWGSSTPLTPPPTPTVTSPWTSVYFAWSASTGATKYTLQVNTSQAFDGTSLFNGDLTSISQTVTGFIAGTTYYWRVRAGNDSGWGSWSSTRSMIVH